MSQQQQQQQQQNPETPLNLPGIASINVNSSFIPSTSGVPLQQPVQQMQNFAMPPSNDGANFSGQANQTATMADGQVSISV